MSTEISLDRSARAGRTRRLVVNALCVVVMFVALGFILPAAFGFSRYVITGDSMAGTYDKGTVVFEQTVPVSELEVGDVITYTPPPQSTVDTLVTHRIVSIEDDEFRTKGDANEAPDAWTFKLTEATQPRVVASVPYVGWLFIWLTDRTTRLLVIGLPAALVALMSVSEVVGAERRPRRPRSVASAPVAGAGPLGDPAVPSARKAVDRSFVRR